MAQKVLVQLVDDLDGAVSSDVETVQFALDGVTYEIDLAGPNARRLRNALAEYVDSARRTGGRMKRGTRSRDTGSTNEEAGRIREWAQANGIELAARGRIPAHVVESYRQAQTEAQRSTRTRRPRAKKN